MTETDVGEQELALSSHGVTNHGDGRWAQQGHTDAGLLQHPNASGQVGVPVLEGPAPGENLTSSGSCLCGHLGSEPGNE